MLGQMEGFRRRGRHQMTWLDGIYEATQVKMNQLNETVKNRENWKKNLSVV